MKANWKHLDKYRRQESPYTSPSGSTFGAFSIPSNGSKNILLNCIATDGRLDASDTLPDTEWEHVSVHAYDIVFRKQRIPSWNEMAYIKSLFWEPQETVMELHVASTDHINIHECVLHLWRPTKQTIPLPPKICV